MKIQIATLTVLLAAMSFSAQAQLKPSSEPRPQMDLSGETIILPTILRHDAPVAAAPAPKRQKSTDNVRNLSQTRVNRIEKTQNGFYTMQGHTDWGTSIRLNSYGYLQGQRL